MATKDRTKDGVLKELNERVAELTEREKLLMRELDFIHDTYEAARVRDVEESGGVESANRDAVRARYDALPAELVEVQKQKLSAMIEAGNLEAGMHLEGVPELEKQLADLEDERRKLNERIRDVSSKIGGAQRKAGEAKSRLAPTRQALRRLTATSSPKPLQLKDQT